MSRNDDLIQEVCPDGVQYSRVDEVAVLKRGTAITKKSVVDGSVPVIAGGRTPAYFHNESNRAGETVAIAGSGAYAGFVSYWSKPIYVSDAFTVVPKDDRVNARYLYFWLQSQQELLHSFKSGGGVPHVYPRSVSGMRIPVPHLEVQLEIVRVLDKFTQLEAELEAELEARRAQYEHYRAQLLDEAGTGAASVQLGDLGRIVTGRTPKSSDASAWGVEVDFVTPSDIRNGMKTVTAPGRRLSDAGAASMAKVVIPAGSLLVTCIGADMGKTVINANDCVTNQQINSIIPTKDVVVEYFFHLLTAMRDRLRAQGERAGGTMPLINKTDFSKIEVPVPSLEVQKQVASKLDNFDALVNDISIGLPAELAARRKQYEHYRDRLLTFRELAS